MTKTDTVPDQLRNASFFLKVNQFEEAKALASECLRHSPSNPKAHHIIALACMQAGDYPKAIEHCQKALRRTKSANIYNDLSLNQLFSGDVINAIQSAQNAIRLEPKNPNYLNTLGNCQEHAGKNEAAVATFRLALSLQPDSSQIKANLVRNTAMLGQHQEASELYATALIETNYRDPVTGRDFLQSFLRCPDPSRIVNSRQIIHAGLIARWTRPIVLVHAGLRLYEASSAISQLLTHARSIWPLRIPNQDLLSNPAVQALGNDPLFKILMSSAPFTSPSWEMLLTCLRAAFAEHIVLHIKAGIPTPDQFCRWMIIIAEQCSLNEYIYSEQDSEKQLISSFVTQIKSTANTPLPRGAIPLLAAYAPLRSYDLNRRITEEDFSEEEAPLYDRHIKLTEQLAQFSHSIKAITPLDEASKAVQRQYEEDPYPFWTGLGTVHGANLGTQMAGLRGIKLRRPFTPDDTPSILVAGCGTGQQSTEAALLYPTANILAIDLSRSSLSFAKMRAEAFGVKNIRFAQADILRLDLEDRFDYIESTGVLHHLSKPIDGWKRLRHLLLPQGIMRIALYSYTARTPIRNAKSILTGQGLGDTKKLRQARQYILASSPEEWSTILSANDFYTHNGCRDLLFHECEHQYTVQEIIDSLQELNFLGFHVEPHILAAFNKMFPDPDAAQDLKCWDKFEQRYPGAFGAMYEMFLQAQ
jgi:Tfp pilus assembly protein PilF/SAM-dependent methyltransferase